MKFNIQEQLGYNLNRVALLIRRELIRCFKEYDISPEQWNVLALLWERGDMNQTDIASVTLQTLPAVSNMIKRLTQNGFVTKERDKKSERVTIIKLTSKGKKLENILPEKLSEHFSQIWRDFPEEKRNNLKYLLKDLREVLGDVSV